MMTTTNVESLFDSDIKVSEPYKKFMIDCLTIDYNKRVSPEYIINYEWPMAKDYVEGMPEENQRHSSIGHAAHIRGINQTQVHFGDSHKTKSKDKTHQVLPRKHSPSLRKDSRDKPSLNFRQSHPIPSENKIKDQILEDDDEDVKGNSA